MRKPRNKNPQGSTISPSPSIFYRRPEAALKREISTNNQKYYPEDTIIYGQDDALPLRIANAVMESPAATACLSTVSQFIKGAGFSDPSLKDLKIDSSGKTLWDLHCELAESLALFNGFAVNFKFNESGKITDSYMMGFESCRFVKPQDKSPYISFIKYNPYFGVQTDYKKEYTTTYPVFDSKEVQNQISEAKKTKSLKSWPGQVYYYGKTSPLHRFYPVPKYWSAKEAIQADFKLQEFNNEELDNGFFQSVLINAIGDPNQMSKNPATQKAQLQSDGVTKREVPTETIGDEFNRQMAETFSGSKKAGTAMVLWSKTSDTAIKVSAFPVGINADRLIGTQDSIVKTITIATQVPSILANISEGVSLGSGGSEIQKAVELMQSRTLEWRLILENFYNKVLFPNMELPPTVQAKIQNFNPVTVPVEIEDKFWEQLSSKEKRDFVKSNFTSFNLADLPEDQASSKRTLIEVIGVGGSQALMNLLTQFSDGKLTESQASNTLQILFGIPEIDALRMLQKNNVQIQTDELGNIIKPDIQNNEPKINDTFKNLTGRQFQGIQRIVRNFNKGNMTFEQAKDALMSGFGMTEEQVNIWLITPDEE